MKPVALIRQFAIALGHRIREQARPTASWTIRLTGSAVAAYIAAKLVFPKADPLLAPLTALLVTQVTLFSIVRHGLDRVLSVVAGVTVATIFTSWVGLTWWSLGLLVACSIIAGQLLRVGPNLIEVPISAMLVMGVGAGAAAPAAMERFAETLIGAVVGVIINFAFPPGVRTQSAGEAVEKFGEEIARVLEETASELRQGASKDDATRWLSTARNLSNKTSIADSALNHAEESRRLNVRAFGTPDTGPAMRAGLDALERCAVAVRSIYRGINDVVWFPPEDENAEAFPQEAREQTSSVLTRLASTIRAFAHLVDAQVEGSGKTEEGFLLLELAALDEERERATRELRSNPDEDIRIYELKMFVLATAGRVQRELDLRGHAWLEERRRWEAVERRRALQAAERLGETTRQFKAQTKRRFARDESRRR